MTENKSQQLFNTPRRTCTCKNILWNLSTNTAAEYGDLGALIRRYTAMKEEKNQYFCGPTDYSSNSSTTSYEPLHLAAQHGHLAVASYLLQQGFHPDSGRAFHQERKASLSFSATPLHRACYSGAIGCVKLLLEHGADITPVDDTFGDGMTPLHKAVKGGRYLAVAVIVHYIQATQQQQQQQQNALMEVMNYRDARNRTPLELAKELDSKGEDEILSLRRWDKVAGGPASFQKCIHILENIKTWAVQSSSSKTLPTTTTTQTTIGATTTTMKKKPNSAMIDFSNIIHHQHSRYYNDPNNNDTHDIYCKISQWERDFMESLLKSIQGMVVLNSDDNHHHITTIPPQLPSSSSSPPPVSPPPLPTTTTTTTSQTVRGQPCHLCKKHSLSLFRAKSNHHNQLLCSKCFRQIKQKSHHDGHFN